MLLCCLNVASWSIVLVNVVMRVFPCESSVVAWTCIYLFSCHAFALLLQSADGFPLCSHARTRFAQISQHFTNLRLLHVSFIQEKSKEVSYADFACQLSDVFHFISKCTRAVEIAAVLWKIMLQWASNSASEIDMLCRLHTWEEPCQWPHKLWNRHPQILTLIVEKAVSLQVWAKFVGCASLRLP